MSDLCPDSFIDMVIKINMYFFSPTEDSKRRASIGFVTQRSLVRSSDEAKLVSDIEPDGLSPLIKTFLLDLVVSLYR